MAKQGGDARVGTLFHQRYKITRKLGDGGSSTVYLAQDTAQSIQVALKILTQDGTSQIAAKRFTREMEVMKRLKHKNIVKIIDAGETASNEMFLATEVVKGRTLNRQIKQHGPLEPARAVNIAAQIADALQVAHDAHIIHRDLKPSNIRLFSKDGDRDFVKILDFGIARFLEDEEYDAGEQLTAAGKVIGTPHYMAPEQIASKPMDERLDLYALGCLLFFMVTGRTLFIGKTFEVMRQHAFEKPRPPSAVTNRPIPGPLEAIILSLVEKDPNMRPSSGSQVSAMLRRCIEPANKQDSTGLSFADLEDTGGLPDASTPTPESPQQVLNSSLGLAALGFAGVLGLACVGLLVLIALAYLLII